MSQTKKTKRIPKGLWFGKIRNDKERGRIAEVVIGPEYRLPASKLVMEGMTWLQENNRDYELFYVYNGETEVEDVSWEPSETSN